MPAWRLSESVKGFLCEETGGCLLMLVKIAARMFDEGWEDGRG